MAKNSMRSFFLVVLIILSLPQVLAQSDRQNAVSTSASNSDVLLNKTKDLASDIKVSAAGLLQFDRGVTVEVRRGVNRLLKSCTAQATLEPSPLPEKINEYIQSKILESSTLRVNSLARVDTIAAQTIKSQQEKCASSIGFLYRSEACTVAQEHTTTVASLQSVLKGYFDLVNERYRLYKDVASKEADGCVKSGFTERLLKANEQHVIENEELARKKFLDLINSADEISKQMRP